MTDTTHNSCSTNSEAETIEKTLRDWYTAIHQQDFKTVADMLTDEFLIVEHTERLTKAQQMARFEEFKDLGTQTAEQHEFETRIHGDVAWTTLRNTEVWTPADGSDPVDLEFIETVILVKKGNRWLMDRYHATSTKPLPPTENT